MSEDIVIQQAAPTLAGIKTGSLFTYPCAVDQRAQFLEELRQFNRRLFPKGLRMIPVRFSEIRVLLYLFRPSSLEQDLQSRIAVELLNDAGYTNSRDCSRCVAHLIRRVRENEEFPHEIGLFLGYPPEDVKGFIDNHAQNFKYTGVWKVYGDLDAAMAQFARFENCTKIYCKCWAAGYSMERLAVAG